jgi:hypothetical protein
VQANAFQKYSKQRKIGAMPLGITTYSVRTFSITIKGMHNKKIMNTQCNKYATLSIALCRQSFTLCDTIRPVMLRVVKPSVVVPSVTAPPNLLSGQNEKLES